jgi:hypothetical protein
MGQLQLTQKRGLLQNIKLPRPVAGQQLAYRIGCTAGPNLRLQAVYACPSGGLHPLVAVDEYKTGIFCHHHNRQ